MRYLMVYTGNEVNMCVIEEDKPKCAHMATYAYSLEDTHISVVVHTSVQMVR